MKWPLTMRKSVVERVWMGRKAFPDGRDVNFPWRPDTLVGMYMESLLEKSNKHDNQLPQRSRPSFSNRPRL